MAGRAQNFQEGADWSRGSGQAGWRRMVERTPGRPSSCQAGIKQSRGYSVARRTWEGVRSAASAKEVPGRREDIEWNVPGPGGRKAILAEWLI